MWNFFLDNTRFSFLLIATLLLFGIFSIIQIPKESSPEVEVPVGIVTTVMPGAAAADVEALITSELERGLNSSLNDVRKITSSSAQGVSSITVEFNANANLEDSLQSLKDEVDTLARELPETAEEPFVTEVDFVDQPVYIFALSGDRTDEEFSQLSTDLEKELESIPGVSRAEIVGVREDEVSVLVDEAALVRFNLTIGEVIAALRTANATFPIGPIVTDGVSYNIAFEGDIATPSVVADIPITNRGGQPVYVRDVATIRDGLAPATTFSRLSVDGKPSEAAVTINIYKQSGADVTRVTASVAEELEVLKSPGNLLADLTTFTIQDSGELVRDDLTNLSISGIQTIILVMLVLVVAIGWREGLLAAISVPLSFMIGFIGLYLSGNTINFISLFALILGIGILVDSAIVVVEGINTKIKDNPNIDKIEAARAVVKEFSAPLISGTLTTVAMFTGLFIVSGVTGQFIASIPFTLIFILFASLLVALGFVPLIGAGVLKRRNATKFEQLQTEYNHRLEDWYRSKITWLLAERKRKVTFLSLIVVGFISSFVLIPLGLVQVVFFAQSDADQIFVEVELPEGTVKETTDIALLRVEEVLYRHSDVIEAFSSTVGAGSAFGSGGQNEKLGNIFVSLRTDRELTSTEIIDKIRADFNQELPDLTLTITQPSNGPPTGSAITVRLLGDDLTLLQQDALRLSRDIAAIEGTASVRTSNNSNSTEFVMTLDTAKTAAAGLNPQVVSQTLRSAVFGSEATTITTLTDDVPVVVRLNLRGSENTDPATANRTTIDSLANIELATPTGDRVLLGSIADISLRESNTTIRRENLSRVVTVTADTTATGNVRDINAAIEANIAANPLSEGVRYEFGGESEESNQAFGELFLALVVGVVLMLIILVLQFDSFRHTVYVLSILPFSLIGIMYGLAFTGSSLSFPSIMGFIALSGIVVNNSILLIDRMNAMRREQPEVPIRTVVIESSVSRLRPIVLTTLTTVFGMIPLLYTDDIWIPLATAVIFGLIFSVIITLILVPVIYSKYPGVVRSKF